LGYFLYGKICELILQESPIPSWFGGPWAGIGDEKEKSVLILTKMDWATRFGDFFTNSSGRPAFLKREPGLPDGLFSNPKSQFGKILEGLRSKIVDVLYDRLEHFTHIWDIYDHLVHFVLFGTFFPVFGIMHHE
jgi:hypothetical protein